MCMRENLIGMRSLMSELDRDYGKSMDGVYDYGTVAASASRYPWDMLYERGYERHR